MKQWLIMSAVFVVSVCVSIAIAGYWSESAGIWASLILPTVAWYIVERKRATLMWLAAISIIALAVAALTAPIITTVELTPSNTNSQIPKLKKFSSYADLESFMRTNLIHESSGTYFEYFEIIQIIAPAVRAAVAWNAEVNPSPNFRFRTSGDEDFGFKIGDPTDFSTTNIQVEGVDEADILKSDGKYLYVVSGNRVVIVYAYPPEDAKVLSEIQENENPSEIYISWNKLVVLGLNFAKVYDVSNKGNPILKREVSFNGNYFKSRMIGNHVYAIIISPPLYRAQEIELPKISCNGRIKIIPATEIYYFDGVNDYSYEFTTIMAINIQNDGEEVKTETFLMSAAQNLFVSLKNIYITYTNCLYYPEVLTRGVSSTSAEKTIIHKIAISDGKIEYKAKGEVPGYVLNQFSMDEYSGNFRIATSTGWYEANHLYVLDEQLSIIGRLENLAPGERIYSARFMGKRAYLVTFVQIDPLFVIDLTDPTNPKILGELKIPGYSDYLHPYDETHIIGVGKDAIDSGQGFAWIQGVKIALFDVSDPENPIEISKYIIGQRGTDSLALHDHRAFLFSRPKNLLVIPAGYYWQQDAYVFNISVDGGIVLKGTITHQEYSVKRSLYIEDVLYTVSDGLIKMNQLNNLSGIGIVDLGFHWNGDDRTSSDLTD